MSTFARFIFRHTSTRISGLRFYRRRRRITTLSTVAGRAHDGRRSERTRTETARRFGSPKKTNRGRSHPRRLWIIFVCQNYPRTRGVTDRLGFFARTHELEQNLEFFVVPKASVSSADDGTPGMHERNAFMSICRPQVRHRSHRSGRHGPEPDPEHERPRVRRHGLQQDSRKGGRVPRQGRQGHEHCRRPIPEGTGRLVEETPSGHDARQRCVKFAHFKFFFMFIQLNQTHYITQTIMLVIVLKTNHLIKQSL